MTYSEKEKERTMKYARENIKRVPLDMQKADYERMKAHAAAQGETVNGFIKRAIDEAMERDRSEKE